MKKCLIIGFGLLVILSLFGCMTPEKHFQKFLDKGGVVNCKQDSILVTDTLFLNGDTVLLDRWEYVVKDSIHVDTKWEAKYRYKTVKDQEKTKRVESDNKRKTDINKDKHDGKNTRKESDNKRKVDKSFGNLVTWCFICYVLGLINPIILRMWFGKQKKRNLA